MTGTAGHRLRFAPSPTGRLHLGNARTALFNYLLARRTEGALILRIEDTDRERSSWESETEILADLEWLGISWEEGPDRGGPHGPYRQSEADDLYRDAMARLQAAAGAYPCFCTPDQLAADREAQRARREAPRYVGRCREILPEEAQRRMEAGEPHVWRLQLPDDETEVRIEDLVRGEVRFRAGNLGGDFILVRTDGSPTYQFAVVVDDRRYRPTDLAEGESQHYNAFGDHVYLKADGTVVVNGNSKIEANAPTVEANCETASVKASTSAEIDSPATTITGQLTVQGQIVGQGGMAVSGGSGASVEGDLEVTNGDVTADGTSLKHHKHTGDSGGTTSEPL
jgi:phage baseplate assembly protein V